MAEGVSDTRTVVTTREWIVTRLDLDWIAPRITASVATADGQFSETKVIEGDEALTLMTGLNKADLRTNTLRRRILSRFYPAGTPIGAAD
jgi:hypothetical protein